ncbi:hypothetical protein SPHV1_230087 [Novosphingobium sp. KN65.2]|nr:hypothetical protein SPHV1_230087 [Novosphingobium sp. KN65.2]
MSRFRELFPFLHVCAVSPLAPHLPPQPGGDPIPEAFVHHSVNGGLKVFKAWLFPARREKFFAPYFFASVAYGDNMIFLQLLAGGNLVTCMPRSPFPGTFALRLTLVC